MVAESNQKPMKNLIRLVPTGLVAAMIVVASRPLAAAPALKPWSTNTHPTDVAKSHVEEIPTGPHQYTIIQGGTMDGRNCRTPMGCGINREGAYVQTWESNRSVRMENVGDNDIVNPWLLTKETWRKGATTVENIASFRNANPLIPSFSPSGGEGARRAVEGDLKGLAPEEGKKGTIIWTMRAPYVFVGGRIESEGTSRHRGTKVRH